MVDGAESARMPIAQRRTARFERLPCVLDLVVYFSPAAAVEEAAAVGRDSCVAVLPTMCQMASTSDACMSGLHEHGPVLRTRVRSRSPFVHEHAHAF
jgi:hypothetical protein